MNQRTNKLEAPKILRCAIYTRKSTEEGLEQEFNSLDAQREAGESFIMSQRHEGWECISTHYDDGGFTGANIERPGLRRRRRVGGTDRVTRAQDDRVAVGACGLVEGAVHFERLSGHRGGE